VRTADAQSKRTATPVDFVTLRFATDPQVSPDGRRVAFVVHEPADLKTPDKLGDTNIWIVPSDGSAPARPFAVSPGANTRPQWSPDGKRLAFISERGEPIGEDTQRKPQLYIAGSDGGGEQALTAAPGGVIALAWSNDGSAIAFTARDGPSEEERRREKEKDDRIYVDREFKYARLFTISLSDRKVRQITNQDLEILSFTWSPDGAEIAAIAAPTPSPDDVLFNSKLIIIRRDSGEVTRTLSPAAAGDIVEWSPDGRTIYFHEFTPQRIANVPALVPAAGGEVRRLTDYAGTVWAAKWLPDSRRLVGEAIEGTRQHLVWIEVATGAVTRGQEAWNGWVCGCTLFNPVRFSVSRDGAIAYLRGTADNPPEIWISPASGQPKRLTGLNPQLADIRLGAMNEITWKNPKDGQTIYGLIILPPDYRPRQLYPTVVQVHGGPSWAWWMGWHGSWHEWGQLLASNGYAVLLPNPRGSVGRDWRFIESNREDWGGADLQDVLAGVDAVVEQRIADPERLGIGGWSYGGFMTAAAVTQTTRFKAAVVGAAVTNLFSFHGTTDITPSFLRNYFVDLPYRRRARYEARSPMGFVHNVTTPALVLHPAADVRVPVGQGMEFYQALKQLGVQTEMIIYPREPHILQERAHQLDLLTRVVGWYDRYLKR
jgi:dipeptidyl aminopeptidase/acylaminoacyl peptidase